MGVNFQSDLNEPSVSLHPSCCVELRSCQSRERIYGRRLSSQSDFKKVDGRDVTHLETKGGTTRKFKS